jgi:hypothetical protein
MNSQQTTFKTVFCLFLLLSPGFTVKWQGTGNMEKEMMDTVWSHIGTNFPTYVADGKTL